jgi:hypothetical protein
MGKEHGQNRGPTLFWCFCSISSKLLLAVFAGQRYILKVQAAHNT